MEDLELQQIWRGADSDPERIPSVADTAQKISGKSLHLVERIRATARAEHRIFLLLAAVSTLLLAGFGWHYPALGILVFTLLMIWKYKVEIRLFDRIRPESSTLEYLRAIRQLLERFMRNYRIGILFLIPLASIIGVLAGQKLATGTIDWSMLQSFYTWIYLLITIGAGVLLSRWWLNFWVNTLYGKKLGEMKKMIKNLEDDNDAVNS